MTTTQESTRKRTSVPSAPGLGFPASHLGASGAGGATRPSAQDAPPAARLGVSGIHAHMAALRDGDQVAPPSTHTGAKSFEHGGAVRGKGTGTSDSIPAMLSVGEVVMPADTVRKVGAAKLLATIDATHTPTGHPAMKGDVQARADGGLIDDDVQKRGGATGDSLAQAASAIVAAAPSNTVAGFHGAPPAPPAPPATAASTAVGAPPERGLMGTLFNLGGAPTNRPGITYEQTRPAVLPGPPSAPPNPNGPRSFGQIVAAGFRSTTPSAQSAPNEILDPGETDALGNVTRAPTYATPPDAAAPAPTQAQVRRVDNALSAASPGPGEATRGAPPVVAPAGVAPAALGGAVKRVGNSYSGTNVGGDITVNGRAPRGFVGQVGEGSAAVASPGLGAPGYGGRPNPLGSLADTNAQIASLQASNASVPQGGMSVFDDSAGRAAKEQFFTDASQRNDLRAAQGAPGGARAQAARIAAAQGAIDNTAANRTGLAKSAMQESGLAARAQVADARAAVGDQISRDRVVLEGRKVALDANRDDRAAAAAGPKLALEARKAELQAIVASPGSNPFQRKLATQALAGMEGREVSGGQAPAGYREKGNGALEFIPGGPADPARSSRAPLNDTQSKALQFGARTQASGELLDSLSTAGISQPGLIKRAADTVGMGTAVNWTQSPGQQQVEQAQRDFVNATLRRESGAAISASEFDNARKQYFPQLGDSKEVQAQKQQNRELSARGILAEVPDADARVAQVRGIAPKTAPDAAQAPASALPSGMSRQVGTSGGKPVYEDANGNRFIGD